MAKDNEDKQRGKAKTTEGGYGPNRRKAYVDGLQRERASLAEGGPMGRDFKDRIAAIDKELDRFGEKPKNPRRETA